MRIYCTLVLAALVFTMLAGPVESGNKTNKKNLKGSEEITTAHSSLSTMKYKRSIEEIEAENERARKEEEDRLAFEREEQERIAREKERIAKEEETRTGRGALRVAQRRTEDAEQSFSTSVTSDESPCDEPFILVSVRFHLGDGVQDTKLCLDTSVTQHQLNVALKDFPAIDVGVEGTLRHTSGDREAMFLTSNNLIPRLRDESLGFALLTIKELQEQFSESNLFVTCLAACPDVSANDVATILKGLMSPCRFPKRPFKIVMDSSEETVACLDPKFVEMDSFRNFGHYAYKDHVKISVILPSGFKFAASSDSTYYDNYRMSRLSDWIKKLASVWAESQVGQTEEDRQPLQEFSIVIETQKSDEDGNELEPLSYREPASPQNLASYLVHHSKSDAEKAAEKAAMEEEERRRLEEERRRLEEVARAEKADFDGRQEKRKRQRSEEEKSLGDPELAEACAEPRVVVKARFNVGGSGSAHDVDLCMDPLLDIHTLNKIIEPFGKVTVGIESKTDGAIGAGFLTDYDMAERFQADYLNGGYDTIADSIKASKIDDPRLFVTCLSEGNCPDVDEGAVRSALENAKPLCKDGRRPYKLVPSWDTTTVACLRTDIKLSQIAKLVKKICKGRSYEGLNIYEVSLLLKGRKFTMEGTGMTLRRASDRLIEETSDSLGVSRPEIILKTFDYDGSFSVGSLKTQMESLEPEREAPRQRMTDRELQEFVRNDMHPDKTY